MPEKLDYQLLNDIANADRLSKLTDLLDDASVRLGASGFFCAIRCVRPLVEPVFWAFSSSKGWSDAYQHNALQSYDPLWETFGLENHLHFWEIPPQMGDYSEFWSVCEATGFQNGVTAYAQQEPTWKLALTFAAPHSALFNIPSDINFSHQLNLLLISTMHALVRNVMPGVLKQHLPKISSREINCLKWAARGKTASEIAVLMELSEATVVFHLNNLIKKLKVHNRTQAIAVGISVGLTA